VGSYAVRDLGRVSADLHGLHGHASLLTTR
jgi:hypothetical protein